MFLNGLECDSVLRATLWIKRYFFQGLKYRRQTLLGIHIAFELPRRVIPLEEAVMKMTAEPTLVSRLIPESSPSRLKSARARDNPRLHGKPEALHGVDSNDLVSPATSLTDSINTLNTKCPQVTVIIPACHRNTDRVVGAGSQARNQLG